ncbi:hypothetical protein Ancab_024182 [Ancistrocladus abbreviatus]
MVWLVSVNFSICRCSPAPQAVIKEVRLQRQPQIIISSQPSFKKAFKSMSADLSSRCITMLNRTSHCNARTPCRHLIKPVSSHSGVSFYTRILRGYWVGPDVEDGWGFVDAFINEIL